MKKRNFLIAAAMPLLVASCMNVGQQQTTETAVKNNNVIVNVPRGEQAPPANPGQRNFGGMMPMGGANRQRTQRPQGQQR